jgi:hypothetical protein
LRERRLGVIIGNIRDINCTATTPKKRFKSNLPLFTYSSIVGLLLFYLFWGVATGHFFGEPLKNTDISDEILVTSWLIPNNHQSTFIFQPYHVYLAGGIPTPLKNHGVKVTVGMMKKFPTEWKVIKKIQTTNQTRSCQPSVVLLSLNTLIHTHD